MALEFPDSPTLNQVYDAWTWDGEKWDLTPGESGGGGGGSDGFTFVQDTNPTATAGGQTWFDTSTGYTYVWYEDVDGGQWVQDGPTPVIGGELPDQFDPIRWFTTPATAVANNQTVAIPFADGSGNNQGNAIGNPIAGQATFSAPGLYIVSAVLRTNVSFGAGTPGIALTNNGSAIQSMPAHGPFAQPSATFLFTQRPGMADASLGISFFNGTGADITVTSASEIVVARLSEIVWGTP